MKLKLMVYDFDGVMTDNKVFIDQNGKEMVQVSRADGLGIKLIADLGIEQIIISTEKNAVVSARAKKLNIPCFQGADDKLSVLKKYCNNRKISLETVGYVGNDINDYDVMKEVGETYCPSDANKIIKNISKYILKTCGGNGVTREIYDLLIK